MPALSAVKEAEMAFDKLRAHTVRPYWFWHGTRSAGIKLAQVPETATSHSGFLASHGSAVEHDAVAKIRGMLRRQELLSSISIFTGSSDRPPAPDGWISVYSGCPPPWSRDLEHIARNMRFAVFLPTPAPSSSMVRGSSPPYFSSSTLAQATMSRLGAEEAAGVDILLHLAHICPAKDSSA